MDSTDHDLVYKWLSNLPDRPSDEPTQSAVNDRVQISAPWRPSAKPAAPEFDGRLEVRESRVPDLASAQRTPTCEKGFGEHLDKGRRDGFERRPRHKTRRDRYEYKGPRSARGNRSRTHGKGKKRPRRRRKHTMNDSFHAQNVRADRLTLPHVASSGIFSKGKTSSPIKLRDVPDLAFSEMNVLAGGGKHKTANDIEACPLRKRDGKENREYQSLFQYKLHEPPTPRGIKRRRTQQKDDKPTKLSEPESQKDVSVSGTQSEVGRIPDGIQRGSRDFPHAFQLASQTKTKEDTECHLSATSCSDNDLDVTKRDRAVESYLLKVLHVGLNLEQLADNSNFSHSSRTYLSLDGLKKLLEERKEWWEPATGQQNQKSANVQISSMKNKPSRERLFERDSTGALQAKSTNARNGTPKEFVGACRIQPMNSKNQAGRREEQGLSNQGFQNEVSCAIRAPPLPPRVIVDSKIQGRELQYFSGTPVCLEDLQESSTCPKHLLQDNLCQSCSDVGEPVQDSQSQAAQRPAQQHVASGLAMIILCEDDELFYRTMNAAYHAIVNPYDVEQGVSQDDSIPDRCLLPGPDEDADQLAPAQTSQKGIEETLLTGQAAYTLSSRPAFGASRFPPYDPRAGPNNLFREDELLLDEALPDENPCFSWLTESRMEDFLAETALGSNLGPTPIVAGFWRQNKLC